MYTKPVGSGSPEPANQANPTQKKRAGPLIRMIQSGSGFTLAVMDPILTQLEPHSQYTKAPFEMENPDHSPKNPLGCKIQMIVGGLMTDLDKLKALEKAFGHSLERVPLDQLYGNTPAVSINDQNQVVGLNLPEFADAWPQLAAMSNLRKLRLPKVRAVNGNVLAAMKSLEDLEVPDLESIRSENGGFGLETKSAFGAMLSRYLKDSSADTAVQSQRLIQSSAEPTRLQTGSLTLPVYLKQLQVQNYQGITRTGISDLPGDARWIFLTGENGFGKTSILQAVVLGLNGPRDGDRLLADTQNLVELELSVHGQNRINRLHSPSFQPMPSFAAYGSARLSIQARDDLNRIREKSTPTYSLFHTNGILLSIETLFHDLRDKPSEFNAIRDIFLTAMPYFKDISIQHDSEMNRNEVFYTEQDSDGRTYKPVLFPQLAAGYRNILAMVGDMYLRLCRNHPLGTSPDKLAGIVLIDEFDLHLHPIWLRRLPSQLSTIFPKVQFIVSTHSPIPILGAPLESLFLKVNRETESGVTLERLPENSLRRLMPNALLTSGLFDLESIFPQSLSEPANLRTEDHYKAVVENDILTEALAKLAKEGDDLPDELYSRLSQP